MKEIISSRLQRIMEHFVLPALASYATIIVTLDLWMLRTRVNTFCLVVNFIDSDGNPDISL